MKGDPMADNPKLLSIDQLEIRALDELCRRFQSNEGREVRRGTVIMKIGHWKETRLWQRLRKLEAVLQQERPNGEKYHVINADIVDIAHTRKAEIKSRLVPDRVAAFQAWLHSYWIASIVVIVLLGLFFLSGLLVNITQLIDWAVKTWG